MKHKPINLIGKTYGHLTVIGNAPRNSFNHIMWQCRCVCGVEKPVRGDRLRTFATGSCGCKSPTKPIDMTGKRFGKLVALSKNGRDSHGITKWLCRCDCGIEKTVRGDLLRKGLRKSCGCAQHGRKGEPCEL